MTLEKQSALNSVGNFALMFAQWLISVLLARMGGFADAGVFSLAMSISNIFSAFANYGIRTYQVSDVTGKFTQSQYLFSRIITITISSISCGVYLVLCGSYERSEAVSIFSYLLYSNAIVMSDILLGSIQMKGRLEINGYSYFIKGVLCFISFVLSYIATGNLALSISAMSVAALVHVLMYDLIKYKKMETIERIKRSDIREIFEILKNCLPLMVVSILPIMVTTYPRYLIKRSLGNVFLGYYSSVFTPTVIMSTMMPAIFLGFMPQLAGIWERKERKAFISLVAKSYGGIFILVICAEVAAILCGRYLMGLVFGEEILPYINLLYFAIIVTGLNVMTIYGRLVLISMKNNNMVMFMAGAELLIVLLFSESFIKAYGIYGAVAVLCIAYAIHAIMQVTVILSLSVSIKLKKS